MTQFATPQYFERLSPPESLEARAFRLLQGDLASLGRSPDEMTYLESRSFGKTLLGKDPQNPILESLVGTLTNPLALIGIVAMARPRLMGAIPVKDMFKVNAQLSPVIRENMGVLGGLRLWHAKTGQQLFDGTAVSPALLKVNRAMNQIVHDTDEFLGDDARILAQNLGVKDLSEHREANTLLFSYLKGLHKDRDMTIVTGIDEAGNIKTTDLQLSALVDENVLLKRMNKLGLMPVAQKMQGAYVKLLDDVYGIARNEKGETYVKDRDKLVGILRGIKDGSLGAGRSGGLGVELIARTVGSDALEMVQKGVINEKEFEEVLLKVFQPQEFYTPLNVKQWMDHRLKPLDPMEVNRVMSGRKAPAGLKVDGNAVALTNPKPVYNQDDLLYLDELGLISNKTRPVHDDFLRRTGERVREIQNESGIGFTYRMDAIEGFSRYVNNAARQFAVYGQKIDDEILNAQSQNMHVLDALKQKDPKAYERLAKLKLPDTNQSLVEVFDPKNAPIGGYRMSDALAREYHILDHGIGEPARFTRDILTNVYIPMSTGSLGLKEGALNAALRSSIHHMHNALDTDNVIGASMKKAGLEAQRQNLRRGLMTSMEKGDVGNRFGRGLTNYFYLNTLTSPGSAILNLMQPLVTTVRFTGASALAEGYVGAFRDIGKYLQLRARNPRLFTGPQGRENHHKLVRQAIPDADDYGLTQEHFMHFEYANADKGPFRNESMFDRFSSSVMMMFTSSEMFNRLVSGNAVKAMARRQGHSLAKDASGRLADRALAGTVRRAIDETQFVSHFLNQPLAFQDPEFLGGVLRPGLFRQFMSFPTRTATSLSVTSKLFGSDKGSSRFLYEGLKAGAISAAITEMGKGFNLDLFPATLMGAIQGSSLRGEGPLGVLPTPPVVSVAWGLLNASDRETLSRTMPLIMPLGVPLSQAMGILPPFSKAPDVPVRRTYADYNRMTPEGRVPLYDNSGRLITFASRTELALRAAGFARFGAFNDEGQMIDWLVRNRDMTYEYRRNFLGAMFNGDASQAKKIRDEFKQRFGFDLVVSPRQVEQFVQAKYRPRVERTLQTLPPELRSRLTPDVQAQMHNRLGVRDFSGYSSSGARDAARPPQFQQDLERMIKAAAQNVNQKENFSLSSFDSY